MTVWASSPRVNQFIRMARRAAHFSGSPRSSAANRTVVLPGEAGIKPATILLLRHTKSRRTTKAKPMNATVPQTPVAAPAAPAETSRENIGDTTVVLCALFAVFLVGLMVGREHNEAWPLHPVW